MSTGFETQTQNDERPVRGQTLQEGEVHESRERDRGRVREPQRLGMSQGTMIREPKYGGGAHPKYGSCRVLVSQIPITEVWSGCPHEVPKLTDKAFLRTVTFSHHRHMVHLVWFLGTLSWVTATGFLHFLHLKKNAHRHTLVTLWFHIYKWRLRQYFYIFYLLWSYTFFYYFF